MALALGIFGAAEFIRSVNHVPKIEARTALVGLREMRPSRAEWLQALFAMVPGTLLESLCSLIPGSGPTIASSR